MFALLGNFRDRYVGKPPLGSVTASAIARLAGGAIDGRSHVMDWFPKLTGYGPKDQQTFREEVKSLEDHGWLTHVYGDDIGEPVE